MKNRMSSAVCFSNIGKRPNHEDNFLINGRYLQADEQSRMRDGRSFFLRDVSDEKVCMYAVSDGMGGHNAGETASRICVERLSQVHGTLQSCTGVRQAVEIIQNEIAGINRTICRLSRTNEQYQGMGATLVLLLICREECAVLNIGDSKALYYDGHNLEQITKDHTEGQRMLDLGLLTRKELQDFPARKHLNRYFGCDREGYVLQADEYYPEKKDGIFLLCSDGITDDVPEEQFLKIISTQDNLEEAGRLLTDLAVKADHADNATIIMMKPGG